MTKLLLTLSDIWTSSEEEMYKTFSWIKEKHDFEFEKKSNGKCQLVIDLLELGYEDDIGNLDRYMLTAEIFGHDLEEDDFQDIEVLDYEPEVYEDGTIYNAVESGDF